jgi:hypothetical protein
MFVFRNVSQALMGLGCHALSWACSPQGVPEPILEDSASQPPSRVSIPDQPGHAPPP